MALKRDTITQCHQRWVADTGAYVDVRLFRIKWLIKVATCRRPGPDGFIGRWARHIFCIEQCRPQLSISPSIISWRLRLWTRGASKTNEVQFDIDKCKDASTVPIHRRVLDFETGSMFALIAGVRSEVSYSDPRASFGGSVCVPLSRSRSLPLYWRPVLSSSMDSGMEVPGLGWLLESPRHKCNCNNWMQQKLHTSSSFSRSLPVWVLVLVAWATKLNCARRLRSGNCK